MLLNYVKNVGRVTVFSRNPTHIPQRDLEMMAHAIVGLGLLVAQYLTSSMRFVLHHSLRDRVNSSKFISLTPSLHWTPDQGRDDNRFR